MKSLPTTFYAGLAALSFGCATTQTAVTPQRFDLGPELRAKYKCVGEAQRVFPDPVGREDAELNARADYMERCLHTQAAELSNITVAYDGHRAFAFDPEDVRRRLK